MLHRGQTSLLAFFLAYAAVITVPATADAATGPSASAREPTTRIAWTTCGAPIAKSSGGYWACSFADNFRDRKLDRDKWSVMRTAATGFSHAGECYVDDPSTVAVAKGMLRLTARRLASPEWCASSFSSRYQSGMLFTKYSFAQTYGRFEARIKFPRGTGFTSAWWMWPRDMAYGKQSGEIDIAEHYGAYPDIVASYVHVKDELGTERGRGSYCNVSDPEEGFHRYAVEWLPLGMVFLFDGVPCMVFKDWAPAPPLTYPQPFDQPFFLALTLAFGWGVNTVTESTPFPATMAVDYVRAWR